MLSVHDAETQAWKHRRIKRSERTTVVLLFEIRMIRKKNRQIMAVQY